MLTERRVMAMNDGSPESADRVDSCGGKRAFAFANGILGSMKGMSVRKAPRKPRSVERKGRGSNRRARKRTVSVDLGLSGPLVEGRLSIDRYKLQVSSLLARSRLVTAVVDGDELLSGRLERVQHQERVQKMRRVERGRLRLELCVVRE